MILIANGENAAGGRGITGMLPMVLPAGIDVITMGNHVWDNRDVYNFIDAEFRLLGRQLPKTVPANIIFIPVRPVAIGYQYSRQVS